MIRLLAVVVLLASCAAEAPKQRLPRYYGEFIDPLPPPPTLSPPPGEPTLVCNGVIAVCTQRARITRCWCGDIRAEP